jgi:hypothetical protein
MIKTDRWKLIEYRVAGSCRNELFDLVADPAEINDVSHDPENAAIVSSLRERLVAWQQAHGDVWMPLSTPSQPQQS